MRRKICLPLLLVALAAGAVRAADPLDLALERAGARDCRAALAVLDGVIADRSRTPAQLGVAWQARGSCQLVLLDEGGAAESFGRALELDGALAEAAYELGRMHATGQGTYLDPELAEELLVRAAEREHRGAQLELARRYLAGRNQDPRKSHQWLLRAARGGDPAAQMLLGARYERGAGLIQNGAEAYRWYLAAAEQGDARAQYNVAMALRNGEGVARDPQASQAWMRRAAEAGYRDAAFQWGELLLGGAGGAPDPAAAAAWHWRAALMQHQEASVRLGTAYLFGRGVAVNYDDALYWLESAGSHPLAHYYRGLIREKGLFGEANAAEAFRLYRSAAQGGLVQGIVKSGMMLMSGFGVKQDTTEGSSFLRALGGLADAAALNTAAWMLVTDDNGELRSGTLAETLIDQAIDKAGELPEYLDTLAAVHAEKERWRQAVKVQQRALRGLETEAYRAGMEQRLAGYEARKPWRESLEPAPAAVPDATLEQLAVTARFDGIIVRLRALQGPVGRGVLLERTPTHVLEIAVQRVESGFLPLGQEQHLVVLLSDPVAYFPGRDADTAVSDFPLESLQFTLAESPVGGWHHEFAMAPLPKE